MNQTMQNTSFEPNVKPRVCPKCNVITETAETNCPKCGKKLQSVSLIRGLGAMSVVLGIGLLTFMSWLSWWMYTTITQSGKPGATNTFTGGQHEINFIIFIFALVIAISFSALVAGLWQVIFGKRNKILTVIVLILGIMFAGVGFMVSYNNHL